jgi:hypothetical protein
VFEGRASHSWLGCLSTESLLPELFGDGTSGVSGLPKVSFTTRKCHPPAMMTFCGMARGYMRSPSCCNQARLRESEEDQRALCRTVRGAGCVQLQLKPSGHISMRCDVKPETSYMGAEDDPTAAAFLGVDWLRTEQIGIRLDH